MAQSKLSIPFPDKRDGVGIPSASCGTTLFILNKNAQVANPDPDDPYQIIFEPATDDAHVIPIEVPPGSSWLDLFILSSGATSPTATTSCRVYGWVPLPSAAGGANNDSKRRLWAHNYDPTNFEAPNNNASMYNASFDPRSGLFIPLTNPVTEAFTHEFTAAQIVDKDSGTSGAERMKLIGGPRVYVAGVASVVVPVVVPDAASTASMIAGRFVN